MGTSLDSCPDKIVDLQTMFNYAGAKKANKKRIKKIQKQLDKMINYAKALALKIVIVIKLIMIISTLSR
jgi:hypothetical protein